MLIPKLRLYSEVIDNEEICTTNIMYGVKKIAVMLRTASLHIMIQGMNVKMPLICSIAFRL